MSGARWNRGPNETPRPAPGEDRRAVGTYQAVIDAVRVSLLVLGVAIVFIGIVRSVPAMRGTGGRGRVARLLGDHAALGLDFFVGSTILNLILNYTWTAVATTAITILVRKLITFSLSLDYGQ